MRAPGNRASPRWIRWWAHAWGWVLTTPRLDWAHLGTPARRMTYVGASMVVPSAFLGVAVTYNPPFLGWFMIPVSILGLGGTMRLIIIEDRPVPSLWDIAVRRGWGVSGDITPGVPVEQRHIQCVLGALNMSSWRERLLRRGTPSAEHDALWLRAVAVNPEFQLPTSPTEQRAEQTEVLRHIRLWTQEFGRDEAALGAGLGFTSQEMRALPSDEIKGLRVLAALHNLTVPSNG